MDIITYALCKAGDKKIMDIVNSLERITMTVVDEVPTVETAEPNKLYLVDKDGDGRYEEYIYAEIDGVPTIVELGPIVDFSAYYTSAEVDALLLPITTELNDLSFVKNIEKTNAGSYVITFRDDTTLPIAVDTTATENSTNLITSGAVHQAVTALHVELTQAEYDALTPEEKNNGTEYFITDSTDSGDFSYLENRIDILDGKSNTLNEIATLEVTDVKGVIHSSASPKYTFIKNKGENDCYISATDNVGEGVDGTILLQSNSTIMLENLSDVNYICKNGKTTVICVCFQNSVNDPFARDESIGSSGGDGGGTLGLEEVVLWENDGTTNPETITLSEAITDFDEIVIEALYKSGVGKYLYTNSWLASADLVGMRVVLNDEQWYCAYTFTTSTTLTNHTGAEIVFAKIIGRRYTKVNPTGYREIELYSNDEHAATPIDTVLTLSQNWADFDAIGFISEYNDEVGLCAYSEYKVSVISAINRIVLNFDIGSTQNSFIYINKNASNSFVVTGLNTSGYLSHVYKIIGIKY